MAKEWDSWWTGEELTQMMVHSIASDKLEPHFGVFISFVDFKGGRSRSRNICGGGWTKEFWFDMLEIGGEHWTLPNAPGSECGWLITITILLSSWHSFALSTGSNLCCTFTFRITNWYSNYRNAQSLSDSRLWPRKADEMLPFSGRALFLDMIVHSGSYSSYAFAHEDLLSHQNLYQRPVGKPFLMSNSGHRTTTLYWTGCEFSTMLQKTNFCWHSACKKLSYLPQHHHVYNHTSGLAEWNSTTGR